MATLQVKHTRGYKYWQIVESRRVNGKPRPIVLAHLGTAETILKKLQSGTTSLKIKSYSHGLLYPLLKLSKDLDIVSVINENIQSPRKYFAKKPIRNSLTAGATLLFAALGRICQPTSKRGWYNWAKTTSLSYLLRMSFAKVDSQHFWDLMDSLPTKHIKNIEINILKKVKEIYGLEDDVLLYDTTNFYTYIATTNKKCTIAQRGKNKQKRSDLRQVGLAMAVSQQDNIPIFHESYRGNMSDSPVFREIALKLSARIKELGLDINKQTVVFDRGCNSKRNLKLVSDLKMFYVGAMTPYHHRQLISDAKNTYTDITVNEKIFQVHRAKKEIWGEERTVLVFVSKNLKEGQIRGIYADLDKTIKKLLEENNRLSNPKSKKFTRYELNKRINNIANSKKVGELIEWKLLKKRNGPYYIEYSVLYVKLAQLEKTMGFRIIMTNRHKWGAADIIKAYHGQSFIENSFKNIKNPFHLAVTPEFHWTDQKIQVHFFTCVLGFLLATIIWKTVRDKIGYKGTLDNLLDTLNNIRLTSVVDQLAGKAKIKVNYQIEEMDEEERKIASALGLYDDVLKPLKLKGLSVYT